MAKALADMHGYEGGIALHGDTHQEEWLLSKDGHLILNDFNNAEILDCHDPSKSYYRPSGLLSL
jgi:hypothetical protein